jgi:RHH-type rel operon transcriptional repressor/antitoxin RelB
MIAVRLTPDIEARLDALAKRTGRTKTYYVREAIIEHLEDIEAAQLALQRWEDVRSGRTGVISLAELKAEYGLDD